MRQRGFLGVLLILLSIVSIFSWEVWARKKLTFDKVLVFNRDVVRAAEINDKMLDYKMVAKKTPGAILWKDKDKVIGKVATQVIPKGSEVFTVYLSDSNLIMKGSKFIVAIPSRFILSMPDRVSKGDKVFLYAIEDNGDAKALFSTNVVSARRDGREFNPTTSTSLEVVVNEKEAQRITKLMSRDKKLLVLCR